MALDLRDVTFTGPAMPEPFVRYKLEELLAKKKLLVREGKAESKDLQDRWAVYRKKLLALGEQGLETRVLNHVIEPLVERLGYGTLVPSDKVTTREGTESGGFLLRSADESQHLRAWVVPVGTDLDAPNKRGRAYRFSPALVAQRVLLTKGERVALLTDGQELRIVLCDPSGRDSNLSIRLDRTGWRGSREVPDSFRLLHALCQPKGVPAIADVLDDARLTQAGVTKKLREQARRAVERFIQGLIDAPENRDIRQQWGDLDQTAKQLWHEGLILVYRLLFVLKLETAADPARSFSFATVSTWRNSYSPSTALAGVVELVRDKGAETGGFLAASLQALFRLFSEGVSSSNLQVSPLGGALFGKEATPLLDSLTWSEQAVAELLDALLWTIPDKKGNQDSAGRERVHYGTLDVEDLGRVYEALLELEPGVTAEPMCRLRRAKLEVVVPLAQAAPYRKSTATDDEEEAEEEAEDNADESAKKTKVVFVEEIPAHRFYLRVGLGRKATGSYYTPHAFVRFLVQETLGPQLAERSPHDNPDPVAMLGLNVLDPAMGSGHFLVETCRYLGEALYEACRLCDEQALEAQRQADTAKVEAERNKLQARAYELWKRVEDLPDPNDELVAYLPSRAVDREESGVSQKKALALCRRLVAVHCLYGVDKNPLAVELARVSLWLESYAEGLPLTFLDHRLVCGDSLTGPFFERLLTFPGSGKAVEELHSRGIGQRLQCVLASALEHVRELEASIGKDVADLEFKRIAKEKLDDALAPLRLLAAAWTGGVMLGEDSDDAGYEDLLRAVSRAEDGEVLVQAHRGLDGMVQLGADSVPYDLVFPEVFHPGGDEGRTGGFHAVLGNPPWDAIKFNTKEFLAAFDLRVLDAPTKRERDQVERMLAQTGNVGVLFRAHQEAFERQKRINDRCFRYQKVFIDGDLAGRQLDAFRVFAERGASLAGPSGAIGMVLPSAFHANAGAAGVRRLFLEELSLEHCYSFENQKRIFDIHRSFKVVPVVARRGQASGRPIQCAFYLTDPEWLFGDQPNRLEYTKTFVERTGGEYLSLLELRGPQDVAVAEASIRGERVVARFLTEARIRLGAELHMANDSFRFAPTSSVTKQDPRETALAVHLRARGYLPLHEGKTFHQFDDRWGDPPRYLVGLKDVADKPTWTGPARFYRVAFRAIASSTNERTSIFCLLPPGSLFGNSAPCDRAPEQRANGGALKLVAMCNTHPFDWNLRQKGSANVNLFILNGCPVPKLSPSQDLFLAHSAVRLSCNHEGYAPLWEEQLGSEWREAAKRHTWPVLDGADARWAVRAAIDAVVADAYGLDRAQYEHVLSSFSHTSYKKAPELCLAAFDELKTIGLEAFTKKHDPYWDIPLVTTLPKPVIDLPSGDAQPNDTFALSAPEPKRKAKRRA
jgi:hypothetical protein